MLWSSSDEAAWAAVWARYDAVVRRGPKSELAALDDWYLTAFPAIVHTRAPLPYVQKSELERILKWKLTKGKWRPQLLKFVTALSEREVEDASRTAFGQLKSGDVRAAIEALCVLKGVGPATASAVLAAHDGSVPFMADEALEAIADTIGPRKYTLPHFLRFAEELCAKAKWLNKQRAAANDDEKVETAEFWTPQRVQLCLYADAHDRAAPASASTVMLTKAAASSATKRKRNSATEASLPTDGQAMGLLEEGTDDRQRSLRRSRRNRRQAVDSAFTATRASP
ncbi:unnamed protein product [Hyaloperonospora brassicae]|uniref:HhH-GPD domain-containing protein n=1 Tax=Hyaloperonospora brassicae TaxID=162125 RepID=A0AAV0TSR9_HYABA|nr:unnamed protein product [Hyaloperonospora brassicae]